MFWTIRRFRENRLDIRNTAILQGGGRSSEDRGQKTEDWGQRTEDRKTERSVFRPSPGRSAQAGLSSQDSVL
ncbi:MAG: hypothetical protein LBD06_02800 [Candidatus Accumulibacter sp.]|nr:hypothetical protein [Accumulibacter sp.]